MAAAGLAGSARDGVYPAGRVPEASGVQEMRAFLAAAAAFVAVVSMLVVIAWATQDIGARPCPSGYYSGAVVPPGQTASTIPCR